MNDAGPARAPPSPEAPEAGRAATISVLIAEDEQPLREALRDLINGEVGMEVVGAAAIAGEAIELAEKTRPDVALLDVRMPGGGGARVAAGIRAGSPETKMLALSAYEERGSILQMLRAGAVGYLVKGVPAAEIVEAIRRAMRGQASLSVEVATDVIGALFQDIAERRHTEAVQRRSDEEFRSAQEGRLTDFVRDVREHRSAAELRLPSEERFGSLLESAPDAVVIVDAEGKIVLVNAQTEQFFGYEREELLGCSIEMLLPEWFDERHVGRRGDYFAAPASRPMGLGLELAGRRKLGNEFPVDISLSATETEEGRLAIAFIRDITERRDGELATRQLAAIVESADDAIIGKTLEGNIVSWNRGAERMYGYSAEEVAGRSIGILVPPDVRDELPELLTRLKSGEEIDQYETKQRRKDGPDIDVVLRISAIKDANGAIVGASTIARDITKLKAQAKLERDLADRRALLEHFVSAAEEERQRIAADIHDDSIQAIAAAGLRLQLLRHELADPVHLSLLTDLEQTIQLSISRLRHLLFGLRPPALDQEGLGPALRMYLEQTEDESTTKFTLSDGLHSEPRAEARLILYRIAQEALTNVRKHAEAKTAEIRLEDGEGGYIVRIADDGVGFTVHESASAPGHLGLAAMRERAELSGGRLRVESVRDSGTTVEVWIPAVAEGTNGDLPTKPDWPEEAAAS